MVRPQNIAAARQRTRRAAAASLTHLTDAQRAAVTHERGPLLVLAGAGTGKTRVLVERIAWLVGARGVPAQNILALTFTDKAANELEERIDLALPLSAFHPWVGTFHRFCEAVLREEAFAIGLDPNFRILSSPETWLLLKKRLFDLPLSHFRPLGNPTKFVQALVDFFSEAKDHGVTPERLDEYARQNGEQAPLRPPGFEGQGDAARWQELAAVYRAYRDLTRAEGVLDFGDLILETLRLFRERPETLMRYRARYPEILVDEFQDTNETQFAILELLGAPDGNMLVASDDDQAIYAFRGSNVWNVFRFRETFRPCSLAVLTDNFRSPQPVLDHAYRLIQQNNPHRLEATAGVRKRLVSHQEKAERQHPRPNDHAPVVEHRHFETEEEESAWIADEITRLVERGVAYRDIAILLRANAQSAAIVPPLLRRDIPYTVAEPRGLLARPEVKDALAYFRLLANPTDGRSLFRLLVHPAFDVTPADRAALLARIQEGRGTALNVLAETPLTGDRQGAERLRQLLDHHLTELRTLHPSAIYLEFLERSGVVRRAIAESTHHPEVLPNLQAFLAYVRSLERGLDTGALLEFAELLDAAAEGAEGPAAASLPPETDAVRVLTVHAAKGLEFPVVFIAGATADRYPSRGRRRPIEVPPDLLPLAGPADLDERTLHVLEERRLFYVALTRAQQRVVLTSAGTSASTRSRRKPSPFIAEGDIPSTTVPRAHETLEAQLALPLVPAPRAVPHGDPVIALSASKIVEYETCPLRYQYRYVLRVPVPPHHAFSFGTTIHDVLRDLSSLVSTQRIPTPEDALRLFELRWRTEGYESPAHERARKEAGRAALRSYLLRHPELLTRAPFAVEAVFTVPLPSVRLTGRIDRIDRLDDGTVLITDFKTGTGSAKDAESDPQLSIYALAARRAFRVNPDRLRLSFVETDRDDDTTRSPAADADTVARVEGIAERIRAGDFHATPGFHCRFCDFRKICDFAEAA